MLHTSNAKTQKIPNIIVAILKIIRDQSKEIYSYTLQKLIYMDARSKRFKRQQVYYDSKLNKSYSIMLDHAQAMLRVDIMYTVKVEKIKCSNFKPRYQLLILDIMIQSVEYK